MSIRIVMHDSKEYSFDRDIVRIGKSSRSDIVLSGDGILQEHAELQRIGGRWLIKMCGDQPLTVDGMLQESLVWLQPGNRVAFNQAGVGFQFDPPVSARYTRPTAVAVSTPKPEGTRRTDSTDADVGAQRTQSEQRRVAEYQPPANQKSPVASGAIFLGILLAAGGIGIALKQYSAPDPIGNEKSNTSDQNNAVSPVAPNEPKVTATDPQPPAPKANLDIASEVKKRCMMLGSQTSNGRKLLGQCWAASPQEVITSAVLLDVFQTVTDDDVLTLFVHCGEKDHPTIYVQTESLRNHSAYNTENDGTMHSAVGVFSVEKVISQVNQGTVISDLLSKIPLREGQVLRQIGFQDVVWPTDVTFDIGKPATISEHSVKVSRIDPAPNDRIHVQVIDWDYTTGKVLEGSVVVDETGAVAGILAHFNKKTKTFDLVRADRIPVLLKQ